MTAAQLLTSIIFEREPVIGRRYRLLNAMDGREVEAVLTAVDRRVLAFGTLPSTGKRVERQAAVACFRDDDGNALEREIVPSLRGDA